MGQLGDLEDQMRHGVYHIERRHLISSCVLHFISVGSLTQEAAECGKLTLMALRAGPVVSISLVPVTGGQRLQGGGQHCLVQVRKASLGEWSPPLHARGWLCNTLRALTDGQVQVVTVHRGCCVVQGIMVKHRTKLP